VAFPSQRALARRVPFFYGKVVLGCAMCASFARQATAVATLSVFVVPMSAEFGWSRAELSGAVSLGGILAALVAPAFGVLVDRSGARAVLTLSSVAIAITALALAGTHSLLWFYVFFSLGRMLLAGPFDIAISAAVANWYLRRRAQAMSLVSLAAGLSLAVMPFIAQLAIDADGWRAGWLTVAVAVLVVGALPNALLMVRRPEDVGLAPDGAARPRERRRGEPAAARLAPETSFTLRQAMATPALWLLMIYTALIFLVQAGISLHQAPHMIQRGIDPTIAASIVSTFALVAATSGLAFGVLGARWPIRFGLALAAAVIAAGAVLTWRVTGPASGYLSATVFGAGIGGIMTLTPVAFADYFGRASYGTIRGLALPVQVLGQAAGPLLAGALFDVAGHYDLALGVFAGVALLAAGVALLARAPRPPRG
jgi:MFS family permease